VTGLTDVGTHHDRVGRDRESEKSREPRHWELSLTGLLIGLLVGITGMGGGSLMTPILILFFGFKPTLAVGTDILHGAVFKSFGAIRHRRIGTVHARMTFWMFLASGPFARRRADGRWLKPVRRQRRSRPRRR
jgi:hypothetical protein